VIRAAEPQDLPEIRQMMVEYQQWLGLDLSFQHFAHEVESLPGEYAAPAGALFIAQRDTAAHGMIALRRLDGERAEMKRLFVRPAARGGGLGRALAYRVIEEARTLGYRAIVLDTLPVMHEAHGLYAALGFRPIPPYYTSPIAGTTFLSLTL
jgi:GNAT superfamily N-acetyltransferase